VNLFLDSRENLREVNAKNIPKERRKDDDLGRVRSGALRVLKESGDLARD
jgi:hypothetical protein